MSQDYFNCKIAVNIFAKKLHHRYLRGSLKHLCKHLLWIAKETVNHSQMFYKIGVLKMLAKFKGKHLCQSHSLNKVTGLRPATLLKKRLQHRNFPANFANFLRMSFFRKNTPSSCFFCFKLMFLVFPKNC